MSRRTNRGFWSWRGKTALASLLLGGPLGLTWVLASPQGAANLDQIRHGAFDAPISPANWVNGNAGHTNAHYLEGHSIAYRAILTDLPVGKEIRLIVEYDIKHSDTHALDYLTHFQRLEPHLGFGHPAEVIDPRIDVPEVAGSPIMGDDTTPIPVPSSTGSPVAGQPTQSYNNLIADFGPGAVNMTIYNGSFSAPITYAAQGDLMASKASSSIEISFVPNNATVVLAWGGHIASRIDWGFDANGVPRSAGGISGSPYHMRLISWEDGDVTLTNLGNQDRSLKASAVFVPPSCAVNCDQAVCVGEDSVECCVEVTDGAAPYSFDWDGPGGFTSDQQCITITNAQLADAGSYSVVVTDKIGLFSSEDCSFDLDVEPNPTCNPDDECLGDELNANCAGGSGSYSCEWKNAGGQVVSSSCDFTPNSSGTYIVVCTDTTSGCESGGCPADVVDPPSAEAGDGGAKCEETSGETCFNVNDASCTNGSPSWSCSGSCGVDSGGNTASPTVCFASPGTCTCTLTCTGDALCPPDEDTADFEVYDNPTCQIGGATIVCPDTQGELYCGTAGMKTYAWSASGNCSIPGATNGQCVNVDFTNAGFCDLDLDVTSNDDCPGDCTLRVTIAEEPVCTDTGCSIETPQNLAGGTDGTILCSGMAGGAPATSCTESLKAGTGSGWNLTGCSVSGSDVRVTYNIPDPSTASNTASIDITLETADGCTDTCVGDAGIAVECVVNPANPICLGDTRTLTAVVTAGLDGQTIDWAGSFASGVDCSAQSYAAPLETCSGLNLNDECDLMVTPGSTGDLSWCARDTEPNGFISFCRGDLLVNPNPDCNVTADPEGPICDFGESAEFCAPLNMQSYSWDTGETTRCITVDTAGEYCVTIVDANGCESTCCRTLEVENCRCRVTGGGNDGLMPPHSWADGEDGDNNWTFGGQAGAPSAGSPAFGEWTHHQKSGSKGRFVFHAGTASAPSRTIVETIRCSDAENCSQARPAPSKQIDFDGVGSIKNGTLEGENGKDYRKNSLLCFEVQIEDLGEPGNQNLTHFDDPQLCPLGGHPADGDCDKCACADWYTIRIWDCNTGETAYETGGYIHGGNLQIHPLVGETYDGPSCGD